MRRPIVLLGLLLGLLLAVSASAAQPGEVLRVIETFPYVGEELDLQGAITVYFDRVIDCSSITGAVSIAPAVSGTVTCGGDNASVVFTPSQPYERGVLYTLNVTTALRGMDGAALAEPYTLALNTVGYLTVVDVLPAQNSLDVTANALITVIFNRPVVPLTTTPDLSTLPNPLTLDPAVEGTGEWLNTSIYVFRPSVALASGTTYTASVDAGLQAVDGSVMQQAYRWSFTTARAQVVDFQPLDRTSGVRLDGTVQVRFNMPMERASTEQAFYLNVVGSTDAVPGAFAWSDDGMGLRFTPASLLALSAVYVTGFRPDTALAAAGGQPLAGAEIQFATVPLPAILSTTPGDGANDVTFYGSFDIYFASPMNQDTLNDKIVIDPAPRFDPDYYYDDYNNQLSVAFQGDASTSYTLTILPGMEDVYGNRIDSTRVIRFTTSALPPSFQLQVPGGGVGFYSAYRDETQVFSTYVNVSQLDMALYSVPLANFVQTTAGDTYWDPAGNYRPTQDTLLRAWTLQVPSTLNTYRYQLLTFGAGAAAADCPGAPPSRLRVGDVAIVTSDPDPVRARSLPPDGEILELLYRDYSLPIVGGPQCIDGVLWWEVTLRDDRRAWVAEAVDGEYLLDARISAQTTPVGVQPDASGSQLAPGLYYLTMSSPQVGTDDWLVARHMMVVATANVVVKHALDGVTVWVTDVQTGAPVPNAPVTVYNRFFEVIGEGTTDADGLLSISVPRADNLYQGVAAVLQTDTQFGIGVSQWSNGIDCYNFGVSSDYYPREYRVYVYTDRPLYRPDQPVYFRGVVRLRDDITYTPPAQATVPVRIYNDQGELIFDQQVPLTPYGTFSGQFDLSPDAGLGYYRIAAELKVDEYGYMREGGSVVFGVAQYRLPEFQVTATAARDAVVQGDTLQVTIDSRYFFGGVVSNATVAYNVNSQPYFFNYTGDGYYDFADLDPDSGSPSPFSGGGPVASGETTTDARGRAVISLPASLGDVPYSQVFTIEAVVTDESQNAVAGRAQVVVHQGLVYVGAAPDNYVGVAGEPQTINLIAVDWDSQPVAGQVFAIEIVERRWSNVQELDDSGRTTWVWEVEDIPVTTGTATSGADGRATFSFTPPGGGVYKVKVTTTDASGNTVRSATFLWVSSREYVSWRQDNSNRIELIADQKDYNVGDTASILITSPFQGTVRALVTVERGDVLTREVITLDSNSYVYKLPITEAHIPNVYVSVLMIKGVDDTNPVATFRMGMVALNVNNRQRELTVQVTPDAQQAGPGDTVTYTVRVTDYAGAPVQAEVGIGLTDLAALSLADPNSGPLLDYFYGPQALQVRTGTALTINTDQLTQTTLDTIKGGGGGFGDGGIFDIRQNFVDTAYWNAALVTGADGTATFTVTLPDNLTTWRLDARAVTSGLNGALLVGQTTADLLSTKPLLIRPVTPRFFVLGDQVVLAAVVNNNTGQEMTVAVTLQASGVTLADGVSATQTVTIPAGGRARVDWRVTVDDVQSVELVFAANGGDGQFTDAARPVLGRGDNRLIPVYRYVVPETVGTGDVMRDAGTDVQGIALPRRFDVTGGTLVLNLQPSLAATVFDGARVLTDYAGNNVELIVSRFLPNVALLRALNNLGVNDPQLQQQAAAAANAAIQRLYALQKVDGGWGWFLQDASSDLTTAWALLGLIEAQSAGLQVDASVLAQALGFLRSQFVVPDASQPLWRLNRQAFVLYVLARAGQPDVGRAAALFEARGRLSYFAQAFLAMTLGIGGDSARVDTLVTDLVSVASLSANGVHWQEAESDPYNWNTDTRTTAIVLHALVNLRPRSDLLPNVVRWLMMARSADTWRTTQETVWALLALSDWMMVTGELRPDYQYTVALNGQPIGSGAATPDTVRGTQTLVVSVGDLLRDQVNRLQIDRTAGTGALYYTAYLNTTLPVPQVQPVSRGLTVQRQYVVLFDETRTPITQAPVGTVVQVRLTIVAPADLHFVVIEDAIPAGTDAVDPNLNTAQQIGTQPGLDLGDPLSQGWGWWWFSNIEFRDEKVVLYATYLPAGTYEYVYTIRTGLAGVYNVIPTIGYQMYLPEVYGRGAGSTFTITDAGQ